MRGRLQRLLSRNRKKTGLFIVLGLVAAVLLGGGAYAALGGSIEQSASGDIELQRGLIGWWRMDGNAKDSTPYARNGTLTGTGSAADRKGAGASAKSFNGTSDTMTISNFDNNVLTQSGFSSSWTMSIWVKANAFGASDRVILGKTGFNGGITTNGSNGYWFSLWDASSQSRFINWVPANPTGWHNIVATYSAGSMVMYGDGVQIGTNTVTSLYNFETTLRIGSASGSSYFNGTVDDARVYSRALYAAEAKALYDEYDAALQIGSGEKGLLGHWKLDGSPKDSSPYANNTSIGGSLGPTPTTDRKGKVNGAYNFDGTPTTSGYLVDSANTIYDSDAGKPRTYSLWFKAASTPAQNANMFYKSANCIGWNMQMNTNGTLSYITLAGNSGCTGFSTYGISWGGTNYADNKWHLATYVVDRPNSMSYAYLDGVLKNSLAISSSLPATNSGTLRIGTSFNNGNPWQGGLDDARIYDRALTAVEIVNLYNSYESQINLNSSPTANTTGGNINQGLVGSWSFTGNAKDSTPYSDNGTVTGATLATDRKGQASSAYSFAANTDNIALPANSMLDTGVFTYAAWVRPTSRVATGTIVGSSVVGGPQFSLNIGNGRLTLNKQNVVGIGNATTAAPLNTWSHVAVSYDASGNFVFYLNGIQQPTSAPPPNLQTFSFSSLQFGKKHSTVDTFVGSLDEIRIYNRVLSGSEIQMLYNSQN